MWPLPSFVIERERLKIMMTFNWGYYSLPLPQTRVYFIGPVWLCVHQLAVVTKFGTAMHRDSTSILDEVKRSRSMVEVARLKNVIFRLSNGSMCTFSLLLTCHLMSHRDAMPRRHKVIWRHDVICHPVVYQVRVPTKRTCMMQEGTSTLGHFHLIYNCHDKNDDNYHKGKAGVRDSENYNYHKWKWWKTPKWLITKYLISF